MTNCPPRGQCVRYRSLVGSSLPRRCVPGEPWQKAGRAYDVGLAPLGSSCPVMARGLLSYAVAEWHCDSSRRERRSEAFTPVELPLGWSKSKRGPRVYLEGNMTQKHASLTRSWLRTPGGVVLLGFLAIATFFLISEHRAHVLGALPYVLLLLCPVLHLLMHRSHGHEHASHDSNEDDSQGAKR